MWHKNQSLLDAIAARTVPQRNLEELSDEESKRGPGTGTGALGIASATTSARVTIVVPAYKEAESLPHLIDRVSRLRQAQNLEIDLMIMDDNSRDGSLDLMTARPEPWIQFIVRATDHGLSPAVLDGLRRAQSEILVCMDADLSHPPEALPGMIAKLNDGADLVVGSRYIAGGTTSHDWGFLRWINSRVATLLARPLTNLRDPMSGFFALRRSTFERGCDFSPVGYKIGLEILVKCRCERVVEIPIHFEDRRFGKSKLTLKQEVLYLLHLHRLYSFKYGTWSQPLRFLVVGVMGTAVNLIVLTALLKLQTPMRAAIVSGIFVAMVFNFLFNRLLSISPPQNTNGLRQFVGFAAAASIGGFINYATSVSVLARFPELFPQIAALLGIVIGMAFNFTVSRYLIFRASHIRTQLPRE